MPKPSTKQVNPTKTVATKLKLDKYRVPTTESDQPYWTLEEGLSFSGFDLWLRCREQFRLSYIQGWRPIEETDSSLMFGSMIHKLIEERPDVVNSVLTKEGVDLSCIADVLKKVYGTLADRPILEARAAAVYRVYAEHHKIHSEKRIDGGAEKKFTYTYKFKHNGKTYEVPLMGYIDCVYRTDKNNIGIRETKTRKQMDLDNTTVALAADLQVNSYFLACEQTLGKFPTELIYDLVKHPQHEPLSANSKRPTKESLPEFHARVYDAVRADPSSYLHRIPYKRSLAEFNTWRNGTLHPHLRDFLEWYHRCKDAGWRQIDAYNPTALVGKYGLCKLFHLVVSGDPRGLTRRKRREENTHQSETQVGRRVSSRRTN